MRPAAREVGQAVFAYVGRLVQRFREENFAQLSASLAFTTLLSLVPLVTVVLMVASTFSVFGAMVEHVDKFLIENLLPGKTGGVIARYTLQFSEKARKLTLAGVGVLALTALMLMFSIERAFNHLWRVRKPRPILSRVRLYVVILAAGPLVGGAVLATLTYAVTRSLGLVDEPLWLRQVLFKTTAAAMLCAFFAFLYYAVPNVKVPVRNALIGGGVATAGVMLTQRLFEFYLAKFGTYTVIYGAFSALPIFLVWLYLCWVIVLVGALVVANFKASG